MPPGLPIDLGVGSALQFTSQPLASFARPCVQDHQVQLDPPAADIATPLKKLANERLIFGCRDVSQHDRQVAGNAMRPQARLPETIQRPRCAGARS